MPTSLMRIAAWCVACSLGAVLAFAEAPPQTTAESPLAARAHKVLATMKVTTYEHVTDIDEQAGEYHCDCSGFASFLLKKEMPAHYRAIEFPAKYKHPRACEFTDAFLAAPTSPADGKLWQRIERFADARAGDLFAWRKDPVPPTGNTGHIVMIDGAPRKVAENIYSVVVVDSTTVPHQDDTRKKGETGIGRGTVYVKVDAAGRPVARAARSADGPWAQSPTAVGRAVEKSRGGDKK